MVMIIMLTTVTAQKIYPVNSTQIIKSVFGGKVITQTQWDKEYPCQLQSDGTVICPMIKPLSLLKLSITNDISKGIPIIDYRIPIFETVQEDCIIPKETKEISLFEEMSGCVDGKQNVSLFIGYDTKYSDFTKDSKYTIETKFGYIFNQSKNQKAERVFCILFSSLFR